ncbi:cationic peroxidase 1-like [Cucurbita pepo subsp. pepo]|uniref:cationic peroxidase 1-like n=1 Tax=Cucurbita pepo subsp. pepo TaxID=3664 RepID=UPI000C9D7AF2|nr:cationic peroxidase 1-like [Cucurbita pepo subsp. pepo]
MDSIRRNLWCLFVFVSLIPFNFGSLSANFYESSCPKLLSTVRREVVKAVAKEYRMGASLLRLHFHDCFVNGCDASVLLDDTSNFTGEKTAIPNKDSLRGFEVIDGIKTLVEASCPSVVSCADILSIAARDSVVALGGPSWVVALGRRDATTASFDRANNDLPSPFLDLPDLVSAFSNKGFDTKELVALSGSHTIGQARCSMFRVRAHNETTIDSDFAASLRSNCPFSGDDDKLSSLDVRTPSSFDTAYFKNLIQNKGLLHSDQALFNNGSADSHVTSYSSNPSAFFSDFAAAMVKMSNLSPLTGTDGEIRSDCRKINA